MPESTLTDLLGISHKVNELSKRVFEVKDKKIYLGGEEIKADVRSVMKDEAEYIRNSRLWEALQATIVNESSNIALIQSKDFDEVKSGKMLFHWQYVLENMIHVLTKKD